MTKTRMKKMQGTQKAQYLRNAARWVARYSDGVWYTPMDDETTGEIDWEETRDDPLVTLVILQCLRSELKLSWADAAEAVRTLVSHPENPNAKPLRSSEATHRSRGQIAQSEREYTHYTIKPSSAEQI